MKIYNYTVFIILMIVLFYIAGFSFTLTTKVVTTLGILDLQDYSSFSFWGVLATVFGAVALGGALIGTISGIPWTFILKGIFVMTPLTLFILDLIEILNQVTPSSWVFYVLLAVIAPLAGGYAIALLEMWDGRD